MGAAWLLLRRRPLLIVSLGLFTQLPGLMVDAAAPLNLDEALRLSLAEVIPKLSQIALQTLEATTAVQPLEFMSWVALTAAGLGLTRTEAPSAGAVASVLTREPLATWLWRTLRGLAPTFLLGAVAVALLLAGSALLLAPLGIVWAIWGGTLQLAAEHPVLLICVLAYGLTVGCAMLLGSTVLLLVAPVATGLPAPLGRRLTQTCRLGLRHLMRLAMVVFWCSALSFAAGLAAGMAKYLTTDTLGMALGVLAGALVAPLQPLAAVLIYREDMPLDGA